MDILCVYQHYANFDCANSGRLFTILSHLARRHNITLISSDHWYHHRLTDVYPWVPEAVDWIPVKVPYSNSMSSLQRVVSYTKFPLEAVRHGRGIKADIVYGISTPLSTGWAAARLARHHNIPWVFEIRDIWPEFPVQMGALRNGLIRKRFYKMERELYESAAHVVTVSEDMTSHVIAHTEDQEKVSTLLQGTNIDLADAAISGPVRDEFDFGERKIVLYAGTFGRANGIPTILDVARQLEEHSDVVFVFTGEGFHGDAIAEASRTRPNVVLLPPIPRHRVMSLFRSASVSLVPFINKPVLATNSPAKFFDSLAVGTPVIVTNPGWTRRFVDDHDCGLYAPIDSPDRISDAIIQLLKSSDINSRMGHNGMAIARKLFDRDPIAAELENIFIQTVGQHHLH